MIDDKEGDDFNPDELDLTDGSQLDSTLLSLRNAIHEAIELEATIQELEEELAAHKKALNHIQTVALPTSMAQLGLSEATVDDVRITIGQKVVGAWPKEAEAARKAAKWLEDHGAGSLIKMEVALQFGRGDRNAAIAMVENLQGEGYAPTVNEVVHPQTLYAFARDRLKNGEDVDLDVLGLTVLQKAQLKRRK